MTDRAVKFVKGSPDLIEGLAIPFGSPSNLDLDGEYFTKDTDLCLSWMGDAGRPILYDHGTNGRVKMDPVGRQVDMEVTEDGVWIKAELDKNSRYRRAVGQLIEEGGLGMSSGSMAHLVTKAWDGRIEVWPWVEESLTPTPSSPDAVTHYVKSASDVIARLESFGAPTDTLKAKLVERFDEWIQPRDAAPGSEPFTARLDRVSGEVLGLTEHLGAYAEMRVKSGRTVSRANYERVRSLVDAMKGGLSELEAFLAEHDPDAAKSLNAAIFEALQSESRRLGVPI